MRLLPAVALTLWLATAYASVGEDPYRRLRKEYGKGLALELEGERGEDDEEEEDTEDDADDYDEEKDEGPDGEKDDGPEDAKMTNDDDEGKTKETSVHRKHFMDQYFLQSGPVEYEFGHVCEDPKDWEQRYEKRDFDKHRHQGQVKWGDAKGGYGEQLWDFNHDGNIEDDDLGSDPWFHDSRQKGFRGPTPDDDRKSRGKGVLKEKVTITKKKNGRTIDQTKINMEKLADIGQMVKKLEPKPFAGDLALIDEFNRKTKGVDMKYDPFKDDDSDENDDGDFSFQEEIRRMGKAAPLVYKNERKDIVPSSGSDKDSKVKKVSIAESKQIRRYDLGVVPQAKTAEPMGETSKVLSVPDLVSKATINIDRVGKVQFDPVSGSLTDRKTGRKFKIFGVLVDS